MGKKKHFLSTLRLERKRGVITVEAAIVFPLFVLVWIPLLYMIRYCIIYEVGSQLAFSIAELTGEVGYLYERASLKEIQDDVWRGSEYTLEESGSLSYTEAFGDQAEQNAALLSSVLEYCLRIVQQADSPSAGIKGEGWKTAVNLTGALLTSGIIQTMTDPSQWTIWGIQEINTHYSEWFYMEEDYEDLIRIVLDIPLHWPDPFRFFGEKHIIVSAVSRGFIGIGKERSNGEEGIGEKGEEEKTIYYRIGNGRKAHLHSCYLIEKELHQISSTEAVGKGYSPCENCHPSGQWVWVTSGGMRYHTYGCVHLFPNLTPIPEEDLKSGKYTPCAICVGGGEWFTH